MKAVWRRLATFLQSILTLLKAYLPGGRATAQTSAGTILKPYLPNPRTGWRRLRQGLLIAAVILFCLLYGFFWALFAPYLMPPFAVPILVLAGLTIWALPEMRRAPTRTMEGLFWAFPVALIMWPNYLAIALPGLPWITLTRLIDFPLAGLLLICVSVSAKFRARAARALNSVPLVWIGVTGFAVVQILTIVASSHAAQSLQKVIKDEAAWIAIFFVSAFVFTRPKRIQVWAALIWAAALFVGVISLWENKLHHVPWAGHIPSFLKVEDETVARILAGSFRDSSGQYRVQSTFTTALGLSEYMALALPFVLQFMVGRYPLIVRGLAAATAPFLIYVILLTDARVGLLGACITFALFLLFWGGHRWRHFKTSLLGPAAVLAYPGALGVAACAILFVGRIRNHFMGGQYEGSNDARREMYHKGTEMILKHPWGYGAGQGAEKLGMTNPAGVLTIDTYYIMIGLEYGVIGFIFYYMAVLASMYYAGREGFLTASTKKDIQFLGPLAISLTSYLAIKSVFSNEDNHPLAFMMMGAVAGLCSRVRRSKTDASPVLAAPGRARTEVWPPVRAGQAAPALGRQAGK